VNPYSVVIPAAGSGQRMGAGAPKAFRRVRDRDGNNRAIIDLTVSIFEQDALCRHVVVCAPVDQVDDMSALLVGCQKVSVVAGGETRQKSVWNGIYFLCHSLGARDTSIVLVHDGARCLLTTDLCSRVVRGVLDFGAVTAALPVVEALVSVCDDEIKQEVPRDKIWAVQTPQGFLLGELMAAHERAPSGDESALDDASLVRRDREVRAVRGEKENIKVTYPDDIRFAELVLRGRDGT
jgi:2-C-methyl-D-erythritol 4-phosphate cytidylyltransferase